MGSLTFAFSLTDTPLFYNGIFLGHYTLTKVF